MLNEYADKTAEYSCRRNACMELHSEINEASR